MQPSFDASFPPTPPEWKTWCDQCQHDNAVGARFCERCGAPVDDWEFDLLHAPALKKARKWMGAIALMYLFGGVLLAVLTFSADPEGAIALAVGSFVLGATQAGLWWWAKHATFAAAVSSLALYVILNLLGAIDDPASLAKGLLIKILFISALVKAVKAGLVVKKMQAAAAQQHR